MQIIKKHEENQNIKVISGTFPCRIVGVILFLVIKLNPWMVKFNDFAGNLPQSGKFDNIKLVIRFLPVLASLKLFIPVFFFISILMHLRKILISFVRDGAFSIIQVALIKRIAVIYLIITTMFFSFNLSIAISAVINGENEVVMKLVASTLIGSLSYLITSLIAYVISEIFLIGFKLRQEADLTV